MIHKKYGIVFLFSTTYSLLVYQSNVPISEVTLSGLHLVNEISPEFSGDLGACVRINYKRLAPTTSQAIFTRIFSLGYPDLGDVPFIWIGANYPGSWLGIGTKSHNTYSSNWVIRELPNNYIIWSASTWHHICLSFSKLRTFVTFVKVPCFSTLDSIEAFEHVVI